MDSHRFGMLPVSSATYGDVSVLDLCWWLPGSMMVSHRYRDLPGLDHKAQLVRLDCVAPVGMVGANISWRRVDWESMKDDIGGIILRDGCLRWDALRDVVGRQGKARKGHGMSGWWTAEWAAIRADVRRFRREGQFEQYCLARKV